MAHTPNKPHAPSRAVNEIVKVFRGQWYPAGETGWTHAQFDNKRDLTNALNLINMLGGWSAELDPAQPRTVRIKGPEE